jgi:hypothetical protein
MKRTLTRASILLLLVLVVSTPSFATDRDLAREETGLLSMVWDFLGSLLPGADKARGSMDPNGEPAPPPSDPTSVDEARGSMDPDGTPVPPLNG